MIADSCFCGSHLHRCLTFGIFSVCMHFLSLFALLIAVANIHPACFSPMSQVQPYKLVVQLRCVLFKLMLRRSHAHVRFMPLLIGSSCSGA
jgi:hypothetical protein